MKRLLAVSEYTIQLVLVFASGLLALAVKGKQKMNPQRRTRNRRTRDPMNLASPPAATVYKADFITQGIVRLFYTAAWNLPVNGAAPGFTVDDGAIEVDGVTNDSTEWVELVCNTAVLADGMKVETAVSPLIDFGPNIIQQPAVLYLIDNT